MNAVVSATFDRIANRYAWRGPKPIARNDNRCKGCGRLHCNCPDPVWNGNVPPQGVA